jgi:hypothetical protein
VSLSPYKIFFGDIHNHNAHGYGVGSIERSVDVARTHLDFFAFTGHSSWHDLEPMEGGREQHWLKGFARLQETWPRVQRVIADANRDGAFSAFLGFEWHSYAYGDQCVVFRQDFRPLHFCDTIEALRRFCLAERAIMIPHHLAYPRARRGVNWDVFTEEATPVVEIYSEHGNSEDDRGPFPMVTHSFGGRESRNTVKAALANGLRFGFVGSSDNHAGFPGAYGEGLMAALCRDLTRDEIFEAIHARRTYALTGDRIELAVDVEGAVMGSTIDAGRRAEVSFDVTARDELDVVEVIQDGAIVHRAFATQNAATDGVFQVRFEWGWGPWAALALDRITDWEIALGIRNGRLRRFFPCLQSGPFDEERRHRFARQGEQGLSIRSYTSRKGAYRENPNQSVVLEIEGGPDTGFDVVLSAPAQMTASATLAELEEGSRNWQAGPFPKESFQFHRIVPRAASSLRGACAIDVPEGRSNVYVRVRQLNGHMAWASPVFMNYR